MENERPEPGRRWPPWMPDAIWAPPVAGFLMLVVGVLGILARASHPPAAATMLIVAFGASA